MWCQDVTFRLSPAHTRLGGWSLSIESQPLISSDKLLGARHIATEAMLPVEFIRLQQWQRNKSRGWLRRGGALQDWLPHIWYYSHHRLSPNLVARTSFQHPCDPSSAIYTIVQSTGCIQGHKKQRTKCWEVSSKKKQVGSCDIMLCKSAATKKYCFKAARRWSSTQSLQGPFGTWRNASWSTCCAGTHETSHSSQWLLEN